MFEGEEEIGSRHLDAFVSEHKALLAADVVVSADGAMWRSRRAVAHRREPRDSAGSSSRSRRPSKDLHSGRHGGGVANPLHAMAALIASLHESTGASRCRVLRRGPRAVVRRARGARRPAVRRAGVPRAGRCAVPFGEPGYTTLERQWTRPTLEVNGLWGGYQGPGQKTVIPSEAHAKITCRLVPDQIRTR
jgi:acetylornithine deacetylase/succinyl-diaminopimelate desuccinylase-like protein